MLQPKFPEKVLNQLWVSVLLIITLACYIIYAIVSISWKEMHYE